jgi:hypothetical protein
MNLADNASEYLRYGVAGSLISDSLSRPKKLARSSLSLELRPKTT